LDGYLKMARKEASLEEAWRRQNMIYIHFESRNEADSEMIKTARVLGHNYKNKVGWPVFARITPGYWIYDISEEDADFLISIFPRYLEILEKYKNKPEELCPEDDAYLTSYYKDGKWSQKLVHWNDLFDEDSDLMLFQPSLEIGKDVKKVRNVWEVEIVDNLKPLVDENSITFFPIMVVIVDEESGMILNLEPFVADKDGNILSHLEKTINQNKAYPSRIKVKQNRVFTELEKPCAKAGIDVVKVKILPAALQFISDMKKRGIIEKNEPVKEPRPVKKRIVPSIIFLDDQGVITFPGLPSAIKKAIERFYDSHEAGEWELAAEAGEKIISKTACMFDVYSFLIDYYWDMEKMAAVKSIINTSVSELYDILEKIPDDKRMEWEVVENRPFLRFMFRIASMMLHEKKFQESRVFFEKLLWFDENDHLGARVKLPEIYFEMKKYDITLKLLEEFPDDIMAELALCRVITFLHLGRKSSALKELQKIAEEYPLVIQELKKKSHARPKDYREEYFRVGSKEEAYRVYRNYGKYWENAPGSAELLEKLRK